MKRLILMRHAEAQLPHLVKVDRDRALSGIGLKQLDDMGQKLHQKFLGIDYVLCSNAKRARQTLEGIKKHLPQTVEISFEDKLYGTSGTALFQRIQRIEDLYQNVLVVGHNPALEEFLNTVVKIHQPSFSPSPFGTCSAAFFDVEGLSWMGVHPSSFKLVEHVFPMM